MGLKDMPESARENKHLTATLILCCLAQFMVILDVSVVNVAIPAIRHALHFTLSDVSWVVNAYTITFAGFLLLGGRAADLLGRRIVFVSGLVLFAAASLAGGLATSQGMLIGARLAQGLGGAVIAPASLSILTTTFTNPSERNRAVGIWGAMGGAGGAAGAILGGILTTDLSWRWILFINIPIALVAALATQRLVAEGRNPNAERHFDIQGALAATIGLSLLVYGIVRTGTSGWGDTTNIVLMAAGVALLAVFLGIEGRFAKAPLMPLRIFRSRTLSAANLSILMVGGSSFAMWFFVTLYLQQVLGYSALKAGLAFLPMTLSIVAASTLASRLVQRTGPKPLLIIGLTALALGLALFTGLPVHGSYLGNILLASVLTAFGIGFSFVTGTIAAVSGADPREAGLASGIVNTSRMFGGALGLAVLAAIATSRTNHELKAHETLHQALVSGFTVAFWAAAAIALAGAVIALIGLPRSRRRGVQRQAAAPEPAVEVMH
jgi:EmrB/QacA subfamily drug resistance transporter